jgi:S1-C subfamily serine protease
MLPRLLIPTLVVLLILSLATLPSLAQLAGAPFCTTADAPVLDPRFGELQAAVTDLGSEAIDCAHAVLGGDAIVQHLASGTVVLNVETGAATFTDGSRFQTLAADGSFSDSLAAPPGILPALLAITRDVSSTPTRAPVPTAGPVPTPGLMTDADVAARAGPSVVQVVVSDGGGSGVAIAAGILTNAHVIDGASQIDVVSSHGQRVQAQVLRSNSTTDLALLSAPGLNVPPLDFEPAGEQRQGDAV